eukprot:9476709-Heterocapsa_arctica.AAC.1
MIYIDTVKVWPLTVNFLTHSEKCFAPLSGSKASCPPDSTLTHPLTSSNITHPQPPRTTAGA